MSMNLLILPDEITAYIYLLSKQIGRGPSCAAKTQSCSDGGNEFGEYVTVSTAFFFIPNQ